MIDFFSIKAETTLFKNIQTLFFFEFNIRNLIIIEIDTKYKFCSLNELTLFYYVRFLFSSKKSFLSKFDIR